MSFNQSLRFAHSTYTHNLEGEIKVFEFIKFANYGGFLSFFPMMDRERSNKTHKNG